MFLPFDTNYIICKIVEILKEKKSKDKNSRIYIFGHGIFNVN